MVDQFTQQLSCSFDAAQLKSRTRPEPIPVRYVEVADLIGGIAFPLVLLFSPRRIAPRVRGHSNQGSTSQMFTIIDRPTTHPSEQQVASNAPQADEALHPLLEEPKLYETGADIFADEGDLASLREAQRNADLVRRAMDAAKMPSPPEGFDGEHCIECEDDLPAKRLEMGYFRCVSCQTLRERQRKYR